MSNFRASTVQGASILFWGMIIVAILMIAANSLFGQIPEPFTWNHSGPQVNEDYVDSLMQAEKDLFLRVNGINPDDYNHQVNIPKVEVNLDTFLADVVIQKTMLADTVGNVQIEFNLEMYPCDIDTIIKYFSASSRTMPNEIDIYHQYDAALKLLYMIDIRDSVYEALKIGADSTVGENGITIFYAHSERWAWVYSEGFYYTFVTKSIESNYITQKKLTWVEVVEMLAHTATVPGVLE